MSAGRDSRALSGGAAASESEPEWLGVWVSAVQVGAGRLPDARRLNIYAAGRSLRRGGTLHSQHAGLAKGSSVFGSASIESPSNMDSCTLTFATAGATRIDHSVSSRHRCAASPKAQPRWPHANVLQAGWQ